MTDIFTPDKRSQVMSRIRSRNTRPELIVRRYLWHHGYRYRLCSNKLPGRPDIVISRIKAAIFINGCFWHGHDSHMRSPESNADYWSQKIARNKQRDLENGIRLRHMGWTVITIWECELTPRRRNETLARLAETLRLLSNEPYMRTDQQDLSTAAEPEYTYRPS